MEFITTGKRVWAGFDKDGCCVFPDKKTAEAWFDEQPGDCSILMLPEVKRDE